ncbi:MAG: hypothetical protein IJV99_01095 [Clostridia bacterium]|nr:hypothetical protein [Clostridia bacterium]
MDKFGIFKLLNSFFNYYEQNKNQTATPQSENKFDFSSLLSNVLPKDTPQKPPTSSQKSFAPLQSSMLSTMNSHDQFIKRVKQNNK